MAASQQIIFQIHRNVLSITNLFYKAVVFNYNLVSSLYTAIKMRND